MNAFNRANPEQKIKMEDFQKYLHLIPFDETGCRIFSDSLNSLSPDIEDLVNNDHLFRQNRKRAVHELAVTPLKNAPMRIVAVLAHELSIQLEQQ